MNSYWYADQGGCHLPKLKAEADNTLRREALQFSVLGL